MSKSFRTKAFFVCVFAYFTLGCMVLTANTVMDAIMTEYAWSDSRGALLITCMSMGQLFMSLFGNLLMEKIGRQNALRLYAVLIAGGFTLFATVRVPMLFFVFLLLSGFSWGGINNLTNTVVTELYDGSAARLNVMNAGFSVGAVLFPLLVGFTAKGGISWRMPVLAVVAMAVILLVLAFVIRLPERGEISVGGSAALDFPFWREAGYYLSLATVFLYVGVETAANAWISVYLQRYNTFFEKIPAQTMVSLMWGMMLVGRLSVAAISTKLNRRVLLVSLAGCFLLGMTGLVVFCRVTPLVILSVVVMGLGMSAMYGTAISNAQRYVSGPALGAGILYASGGLASSVVPFIAGLVSDMSSLRMGMASLCGFLALLVGVTVISMNTTKEKA